MRDAAKAKDTLTRGGYTCVLCKGDEILNFTQRGVKPLVELLREGKSVKGFAAADKVVGRATAFLYVLLGVGSVYAAVISRAALDVLQAAHITTAYTTLTPRIINRKGDGICPFEAAVLHVTEPRAALDAILSKMAEMGIE